MLEPMDKKIFIILRSRIILIYVMITDFSSIFKSSYFVELTHNFLAPACTVAQRFSYLSECFISWGTVLECISKAQ